MNQNRYEDILSDRRQEVSNWLWVSRALKSKVAVEIKPRPTPNLHKESVLGSPKIKELINEISKEGSMTKDELAKEIRLILEEIGYNKNLNIIRWLGYTLIKICLNVCSGIYVNYEGILEIKSKMGRCPVIFVPSHRSYADFIILSYVCFNYDIEIPSIAAGMDFHGMMGMGEILRNTGAFFMRRSYNNDTIYWTAFKEYIYQIVAKGDLPIEFFIEGTRSRSNKSISPKYGLFNMILKAFFLAQVPDILFVPVSINYERILEERLFAFELLGIPKPKESTSGFFKSLKIIKEKFGNIYFHVGKPISARHFFGDQLDTFAHSFASLHLHEITEQEKRIIPPLAYEIIRMQQLGSPVSYFNLIALIFNNNLIRGQELTRKQELLSEIKMLKRTFESWGATILEQDIEKALKDSLLVHSNLISCQKNGMLGLVTNKITIDKLNKKKIKAHGLSEDTITYSVPFVMLQIYVNPVLHYMIDAALIVIILRSLGKMRKDELFRHFCTLRSIFFFEFVQLESWYNTQFQEALVKLTNENIMVLTNDEYNIFKYNFLEEVLISSIQPFILTYYVVTEVLQEVPEIIDEQSVLANIQKWLEDAISKRKIFIHPYCLTLESLANCLNSFSKMNVVKKTIKDGKNAYQVDQEEVDKVRKTFEVYIPSFNLTESCEIFLHIKSKI